MKVVQWLGSHYGGHDLRNLVCSIAFKPIIKRYTKYLAGELFCSIISLRTVFSVSGFLFRCVLPLYLSRRGENDIDVSHTTIRGCKRPDSWRQLWFVDLPEVYCCCYCAGHFKGQQMDVLLISFVKVHWQVSETIKASCQLWTCLQMSEFWFKDRWKCHCFFSC